MRKKVSLVLVAVFLLGFCLLVTHVRAQESKPQLYVVWDVIVYPDKFMEYEAGMVEAIKFYTKHDFPWGWAAYRTDDFHYYFLMPIENMAQIDKFFEYGKKMQQTAGSEYMAMAEGMLGTYESETLGVVLMRTDISYIPENPRVASEDMTFFEYSYYYLKPGMEMEAEKLAADWHAYFKSQDIKNGFNIFTSIMWADQPLWVVTTGYQNKADYHAQAAKMAASAGEDYLALAKKTMDGCRMYERRTGVLIPEMSYVPKKK